MRDVLFVAHRDHRTAPTGRGRSCESRRSPVCIMTEPHAAKYGHDGVETAEVGVAHEP